MKRKLKLLPKESCSEKVPGIGITLEEDQADVDEEDIDLSFGYSKYLSEKRDDRVKGLPRRGKKDFQPDGTLEQQESLNRSRSIMYQVIGERQPVKYSAIIGQTIDPSNILHHIFDQYVMTDCLKGKYASSMGHYHKPYFYLMIEEALFLTERGLFILRSSDENIPSLINLLSLERTFQHLLNLYSYSFEHYFVYAYLRRLGYVLTRYHSCMFDSTTSMQEQTQTENAHKSDYLSHVPISLLPSFLVYKPSHVYRKSEMAMPQYFLYIESYSFSSTKHLFERMFSVAKYLPSTIPIQLALVTQAQISFCSLSSIPLPSLMKQDQATQ